MFSIILDVQYKTFRSQLRKDSRPVAETARGALFWLFSDQHWNIFGCEVRARPVPWWRRVFPQLSCGNIFMDACQNSCQKAVEKICSPESGFPTVLLLCFRNASALHLRPRNLDDPQTRHAAAKSTWGAHVLSKLTS